MAKALSLSEFGFFTLALLLISGVGVLRPWYAPPEGLKWQAPPLKENEVLLSEVRQWPADSFLWIDARSAEEYEEDHIPGAILVNQQDWDNLVFANLEKIAGAPRIVVYCDSRRCDAGEEVANLLVEGGFAQGQVHVLHNGWQAWQRRRSP